MQWRDVCEPSAPPEQKGRRRILNIIEALGLTLASPLALGAFVLVGSVAQSVAGPAVVLALIFATLAAVLTGICYAELGMQYRDTRSPASYALTLCGAGRFTAFLVAWHLALDFTIGAAIASRGVRAALDSLLNGWLTLIRREFATPKVAVTVCTLFGIIYIVIAGSIDAGQDSITKTVETNQSWSVVAHKDAMKDFMPFGFLGVLQGASILIFAFFGIDKLISSGRRVSGEILPWSVPVISGLTLVGFLGVGLVLTFMESYELLDGNAAVVTEFSTLSSATKWIVCLIVLVTLLIAVNGNIFTASKYLKALEEDGLLWSSRVRTTLGSLPILLTIATVAGMLGAFFQEKHLALMLTSGTILAMIAVPISMILHRCRCEEAGEGAKMTGMVGHLIPNKKQKSSQASSAAAAVEAIVFCACGIGACATAVHGSVATATWSLVLLIIFTAVALLALALLSSQPTIKPTSFAVPLAPLVGGLAVLVSCFLLVSPSHLSTWIRLVAWTIAGVLLFALRHGGKPLGALTAASMENGKSSPPRHSEVSGFSLEVEQTSVSTNTGDVKRDSSSGLELSVTPPLQDTEDTVIHENKQQEIIAPDTDRVETIDLEKAEKNVNDEHAETSPTFGFDEKAFDKIWEDTVVGHDESNSETGSVISALETVAQVHESSTTEDGHTSDASEDTTLQEIVAITPFDANNNDIEVVVELNGADIHNETSDEDEQSLEQDDVKSVSPSVIEISSSPVVSPKPMPPPLPSEDYTPVTSSKQNNEIFSAKSFQDELKETLKLRNQKNIDEIHNQVINVNEGIAIFGGRNSKRNTSNESTLDKNESVSLKTAMKAGKFEDPNFVYKLNSILKGQQVPNVSPIYTEKPPGPLRIPPRQKDVRVVISGEDDTSAASGVNKDEKSELAVHMQQMRSTLSRLLDARRDSVVPSPPVPPPPPSLNKKVNGAVKAPAPHAVHKTLESLGTNVEIVSL
ncbi:hypothetical protein B566_EDAN016871 [Ephemera danica]|nr:hypothetical protein B566_EDAN016871 [Ephemera danica]